MGPDRHHDPGRPVGQALKDIGQFDFATRDAEVAVSDELTTQLDADDWPALAAIDVEAPAFGWPLYYAP